MNERHPAVLSWEAHEFEHNHKSSDWYWGLGVIAIVTAAAAIIFNNVILGILILVASGVVGMFAATHHEPSRFSLNKRGLTVDNQFYSFQGLHSYWIDHSDEHRAPRLLIKSQKPLMPLIVIPLPDIDEEVIDEYLSLYLQPEELAEPIAHKIFEKLGF